MRSDAKQYVCVCGQGWSGSLAVVEYLNDFSDCYAINTEIDVCLREFGIFGMYLLLEQNVPIYGVLDRFDTYIHHVAPRINYMPHVCEKSLEEELLRISKEFLDKICWRSTRNFYTHDLCFIDKIIKNCVAVPVFKGDSLKTKLKKALFRRIINGKDATLQVECPMLTQPKDILRVCVTTDEYKEAAKQFLRDYAALFTDKPKFIVDNFVDLEFLSDGTFDKLRSFFDDLKVVFVCRDPRDQFVSQSKRGICSDERVDEFIRLSKERSWKNYPHNNPSILDVRFEDFVLKHEETSKKILDFLGIDAAGKIAEPKYDLDFSKNNVGRWKAYPNQKVMEKIASELKEYIYDEQ
ncbi:MAG: sulfotransferase [Alphaproteobacteria bacterium]|nr:sulfotransferase [Alphaproteobacteria bacterium]